MLARHRYKNLIWVDLESPTREEIKQVMEEFDINPLIAEELLAPSPKPKVERYPDMIHAILHFPVFRHSHDMVKEEQEVDFVIGKKFLVTARYDMVDPLHKFTKVFEVNSILGEHEIGEHAGHLFFFMLRKLYRSVEHEIEYLNDYLHEIETHIFSGMEKEMVIELSRASRVLLSFRHSLMHHRPVLDSLEAAGKLLFGDAFGYHMHTIVNEYERVKNAIEMHTATIAELRETNNSLLSTKQNEAMTVLTVIASVIFPLTLITSLFSMDTVHTPIVGSANDFGIILAILLATAGAMLYAFKRKKWL